MKHDTQPSKTDLVKLLIVDDDELIPVTLGHLLSRHFDISAAHSADQALDVFEAESPQLVLVDFVLPGSTGVKLCQKIRAAKPDTLRVLMTGYHDTKEIRDALHSGDIDDYLQKPINIDALRQLLFRGIAELKNRAYSIALSDIQSTMLKKVTVAFEQPISALTAYSQALSDRNLSAAERVQIEKSIQDLSRQLSDQFAALDTLDSPP